MGQPQQGILSSRDKVTQRVLLKRRHERVASIGKHTTKFASRLQSARAILGEALDDRHGLEFSDDRRHGYLTGRIG